MWRHKAPCRRRHSRRRTRLGGAAPSSRRCNVTDEPYSQRSRQLTTALDTQTATSDILRVISRSQTDVQPIFDAIVTSAVKLLRGIVAAMSRLAGDRLELAAFTNSDSAGDAAVRSAFPQLLDSDSPHSRVVRGRVVLNVADARSGPRLPEAIR